MNRPKVKGTTFERAVCDYLAAWFPNVERQCLRGRYDRGDLLGIPSWACELKAEKKLDPTTALKEAEAAQKNTGAAFCAAILKRPRQPISKALVVMTLEQWADLVADGGGGNGAAP